MTDEWKASASADGDTKSWQLLEKTLLAGVQEQRRARRWGIFFKLLTFIYIFGALALFSPMLAMKKGATTGSHTAVVEVRGMIADQVVDGSEHIPFRETRNYLMRVAESLPIYRARLGRDPHPVPFSRELSGATVLPLAP